MHCCFELIPLSENQRPIPSVLEGTFHLSLGRKKKSQEVGNEGSPNCLTTEHIAINFDDILRDIDMANVHPSLLQLLAQFTAGAFEILSVQFWLSDLALEFWTRGSKVVSYPCP